MTKTPRTPAKQVPDAYEEASAKYKVSGNLLRGLDAIIGVGLVIAMSFSLAHDWNSMSDLGKVLGLLNTVVQALVVLLDIIDAGVAVGLWAVTGTMSVALPLLGAVLTVIGVVIMPVQLFINLFAKNQELPDPIGEFIRDRAHGLISGFDNAPTPQLRYSTPKLELAAGQVASIKITGTNESSTDGTVSHTDITIYSGDDEVSIFRSNANDQKGNIKLASDVDPPRVEDGHIYVTPKENAVARLLELSRLGNTSKYFEYNLKTAGLTKTKSQALGNLVLKLGAKFESVWTGMINKKGEASETSVSWMDVVEYGLKKKCQAECMLRRV